MHVANDFDRRHRAASHYPAVCAFDANHLRLNVEQTHSITSERCINLFLPHVAACVHSGRPNFSDKLPNSPTTSTACARKKRNTLLLGYNYSNFGPSYYTVTQKTRMRIFDNQLNKGWPITVFATLMVGLRGSTVERQSLASVLSPSCARPVADGRPLMWVSRPL